MGRINATDSLKESIRLLEFRQMEERNSLKEHLNLTYQSLKPINLLKKTLSEIGGNSDLKTGFYETILPIITGFLTQRMMVRSKASTFMKIMGAVLQYGLTTFVTKNTENIRFLISGLIDKLFNADEEEEGDEDDEIEFEIKPQPTS